MKRLAIAAVLLSVFLFALVSSAAAASPKQRAAAMQGYKLFISMQKLATQKVESNPSVLDHLKSEGQCVSGMLKELDQASRFSDLDAATTVSLFTSSAFAVQASPAFAERSAAALRLASMSNKNIAMRKVLLFQARHIETLLDMPSASSCSLLQDWQSQGYIGLNEMVDSSYGYMVLQNLYDDFYKDYVIMQEILWYSIPRLIGEARSAQMKSSVFSRATREWYKGAFAS